MLRQILNSILALPRPAELLHRGLIVQLLLLRGKEYARVKTRHLALLVQIVQTTAVTVQVFYGVRVRITVVSVCGVAICAANVVHTVRVHFLVEDSFKQANCGHIRDYHDHKRYVEGKYAAVQAKVFVEQSTRICTRVVHVCLVVQAHYEQRRANAERDEPHENDLHQRVLFGLVEAVCEGKFDFQVAVHGHSRHMVNGGRAAENVECHPYGAYRGVKRKYAVEYFDEETCGHHEQSHHAIGDGQRHQEEIRFGLQFAHFVHGDHYKCIAKYGGYDD